MNFSTAVLIGALLLPLACSRHDDLPATGTNRYRELCAAFYLGLSALQSGEDVNARKGLTRSTELAAGEPAGWANLGLLQFRQQDYDGAYQSVQKARALVPDNSRMEALLGVIESRRGQSSETLSHLKRAVQLDGTNLKALYSLAQETERQNSGQTDEAAQKLLLQIVSRQPNNIAVLLDLARLSAKRNDATQLRQTVAALSNRSDAWPAAAKQLLGSLEIQARGSVVRTAAVQVQFLRNVLVRVPAYRQSLDEVKTPVTSAGEPFLKFLKLPSPSSDPNVSDHNLQFDAQRSALLPESALQWIGTFVPDDKSQAQLLWVDQAGVHLENGTHLDLPGKEPPSSSLLSKNAILPLDLNYDFKTDLVLATGRGLRFYQQESTGRFSDITSKTGLPASLISRAYTGAWAFDFDLDGDLDIVLGVSSGDPLVLRNNGDGTLKAVEPFKGVDGLLDFVSADIDGDGDPDVAVLDKDGRVKVFANERLGDFRLRAVPAEFAVKFLRLAAADVNGDGLPDFIALADNLRTMRLSDTSGGKTWTFAPLTTGSSALDGNSAVTLTVADLDNNGGLDLIVGEQVFLGDAQGFRPLKKHLAGDAWGLLEGDNGRLRVITLGADYRPSLLASRGEKQYRWQDVRPRAATTTGDQRINSFGFGGEIEIRADLLTQKQIITSPILHFGLGDHPDAEFARIVWPNGLIQTEFSLKANQTLLAEQRLKGSCPLLFAWNGQTMQYVKDVAPMSAALGAHDSSGEIASVSQTQEWFKVDGSQLQSRNGSYQLSVTDEYWESYFIDHYGLLAVDHPEGTQIFVDERVATPPAPLKIYSTGPLHPFAEARDESGRDVAELVAKLDRRYLNTFQLGAYQGIAQDHWVELTLPMEAPSSGPLYLIAQGWLHPWDDGLLVAINQGHQPKPRDLSMEVLDQQGHWRTIAENLGVLAGREKTLVLDLSSAWHSLGPRKLRLRTNLEIYWDRLQWASGSPAGSAHTTDLLLEAAELRHRGFSQVESVGKGPEVPNYNRVVATGAQWNNIEGYYTRYGSVKPLLERIDDRFAIVASGDELRMTFKAAPPCPLGQSRDFVFVGDGWLKEGDYSFAHSTTLLPLPSHARTRYLETFDILESDRAYQSHKADWQTYHTRYIGPARASTQLRSSSK